MWDDRSSTITPWRFSDEPRAIAAIERLLPDEESYFTWSHFSFVAESGHVHSVDLLVATPAGLCLIELKTLLGQVRNVGPNWLIHSGGRAQVIDSPRQIADLKAAHLAAVLGRAAAALGQPAPAVSGAVYLLEPDADVHLTLDQAERVYGPDSVSSARLQGDLTRRPTSGQPAATRALPELLHRAGCTPVEEFTRIGTWQITEEPIWVAPDWQDYRAWSTVLDKISRVTRVYVAAPAGGDRHRALLEEATLRERLLLSGLRHPGIVEVDALGQHRSGPALLMHQEPTALRLDHYLAVRGTELDTRGRAGIVRQLGDAIAHAHANGVRHTALTPWSVVVSPRPPRGGTVEQGWLDPRTRIAGWFAVALADAAGRRPPDGAADELADLLGLARLARAVQTGRVADDGPADRSDDRPTDPRANVSELTDRLVDAVLRGAEIDVSGIEEALCDWSREEVGER